MEAESGAGGGGWVGGGRLVADGCRASLGDDEVFPT